MNPLLRRLLSATPEDAELHEGLDLGPLLDAATPPAPAPPSDLRARLLRSASPYASFADRVAALFEVGVDTARQYLRDLGLEGTWTAFTDACALVHVAGGPALVGADIGFVRVADGAAFPAHIHDGMERTLVLAGVMVEADGSRHGPGALIERGPGDHAFSADGELIFAVVVFGVRFPSDLQDKLHG